MFKIDGCEVVNKRRGRPLSSANPRPGRQYFADTKHEKLAEFVRAWQSSCTAVEAAAKAGMILGTCKTKASKLRKLGVRLKAMPIVPTVDVAKLNEIVDELDKQAEMAKFDRL